MTTWDRNMLVVNAVGAMLSAGMVADSSVEYSTRLLWIIPLVANGAAVGLTLLYYAKGWRNDE